MGVVFRYVLNRTWQGVSQASGPQVWIYTMLESPIFATSYYWPFALIRSPTRVSVRVCNIAVDPRVLGVLQIKWYQSQHCIKSTEENIKIGRAHV